jgi:hypothetical protein
LRRLGPEYRALNHDAMLYDEDGLPENPAVRQLNPRKLGALGDIVQAMGSMAAIRAFASSRRPDHVAPALLTTRPYADLLRQAPYFDDPVMGRRAAGLGRSAGD